MYYVTWNVLCFCDWWHVAARRTDDLSSAESYSDSATQEVEGTCGGEEGIAAQFPIVDWIQTTF